VAGRDILVFGSFPAMRLVSLCPSITESLVALGLVDELVGVTRYCVHPKEAVARVPKMGGTKNPDLEAIRAARPDLVFCNAEENRAEDIAALSKNFKVDLSHPRTVAEIPALLRHFGRLTGTGETAEGLSLKVEKALERVDERVAHPVGGGGAPSRFRFVYLIWKDPWMTIGPGTYIADLIRTAGGVLSLEENKGVARDYPETSVDEIMASRPDVLLLPDEPYRFREEHARFWRERLPASRVLLVSGDDFCWHGVRTLHGLEAAAALAAPVQVEA
jgi:iron complex transport system substrate-binding protein